MLADILAPCVTRPSVNNLHLLLFNGLVQDCGISIVNTPEILHEAIDLQVS